MVFDIRDFKHVYLFHFSHYNFVLRKYTFANCMSCDFLKISKWLNKFLKRFSLSIFEYDNINSSKACK